MWIWQIACTAPSDSAVHEDWLTAEHLHESAQALTDLGPRMNGTPEEAAAASLIEGWFVDAGLAGVEAEPFVWDCWQRGSSSVSSSAGSATALAWSPSPSGSVTGELARVEGDVDGKMAFSRSAVMSRAEAFTTALLGGAVGLVHVSEDVAEDGTDLIEVGHTLDGSTLPAAAVGRDDGNALTVGDEVTLTIASSVIQDHESVNVLGRIPGTGAGRVYVVAHYDSWDPSESAFDNALGVAAMRLLALQALQSPAPRREIVFIATSGEEQGLQGAQAWVEAHEDEVRASSFVITLDVLWSGSGSFLVSADSDADRELGMEAAVAEGLEPVAAGSPSAASDHLPFQARGLPAFWATRQPDPHYHTTHDTLGELDMDLAAAALRSQWRVLVEVAEIPEG